MKKNVNYNRLIQYIIAFFTLILAIRILIHNYEDVVMFLHFEAWQIFVVLFLFFAAFISSKMPFFYIIRKFHKKTLPFVSWLRIMAISTIANSLFPQSGIIYRAVSLKEECGLSYTQYIHVFALFGWITILLDLLLTTIIIIILHPHLSISGVPVVFLTIAGFFLILTGPVLILKTMNVFNPSSSFLIRIYEKSREILVAMRQHGKDSIFLLNVAFFGVLSFIIFILIFKYLLSGIDVEVGYAHIALLVVIKKISGLIIITPGNVGVQELLYGIVCEAIGIGAAQGIMASLLLRVAAYLVIFPVGIVLSAHRRFALIR